MPPTVAGYKPEDILAAPLEQPEPKDKRPPNIHQKRTMMVGFLIVIAGLFVLIIAGFATGIGVIIAGAMVIATSVLIRI